MEFQQYQDLDSLEPGFLKKETINAVRLLGKSCRFIIHISDGELIGPKLALRRVFEMRKKRLIDGEFES